MQPRTIKRVPKRFKTPNDILFKSDLDKWPQVIRVVTVDKADDVETDLAVIHRLKQILGPVRLA